MWARLVDQVLVNTLAVLYSEKRAEYSAFVTPFPRASGLTTRVEM